MTSLVSDIVDDAQELVRQQLTLFRKDIRNDIITRHAVIDWNRHFPWWPQPAHVKILFYADGGIQFNGGPFFGLKQVIAVGLPIGLQLVLLGTTREIW